MNKVITYSLCTIAPIALFVVYLLFVRDMPTCAITPFEPCLMAEINANAGDIEEKNKQLEQNVKDLEAKLANLESTNQSTSVLLGSIGTSLDEMDDILQNIQEVGSRNGAQAVVFMLDEIEELKEENNEIKSVICSSASAHQLDGIC